MLLDGFGFHIPQYLSPVITFGTVGYFFYKSHIELKTIEEALVTKKGQESKT